LPLFYVAERRERVAQGETLGGLFEQFGPIIKVSNLAARRIIGRFHKIGDSDNPKF